MYTNPIWETEEERRKRESTPLQGIQYKTPEAAPAASNARYQPGPWEQLGTMYVSGKAVKGMDYGVDKGWDWAKEKVAPQTNTNPAPQSATVTPTAPLSAPVENTASLAGDYTNAMDLASDAVAAPLAEAPVQLGEAGGEAIAGEIAQTGLTEAGAEAAAEGLSGSVAGPLAGIATYAKTGDEKKAIGSGAGAYAGAIAGSAFGPVGTFIGSALGSYIGSSLF